MNAEMKRRMADSIRSFRMPRYAELPDVGLYLEQTTKYINSFFAPLGCIEVTASMISNYVKKGLIPKPVKKQYYAEHIIYLFFTLLAKHLVAIEDVGLLVAMQRSTYSLPVAYDYMCSELENALFYVFGLRDSMEALGETHSDEKELLRNLVFSAANVVYLNACFKQLRGEQS